MSIQTKADEYNEKHGGKWTLRNLESKGACKKRLDNLENSFVFNEENIFNNNVIFEKIHC